MLNEISTGKKIKPITMVLHAEHGTGKTTFGTNAPNPIYIAGEEIEEIDAAKFPKVKSFREFLDRLTFIREGDHQFKTLVIDTLDSIESLLWKDIIEEEGAKDMATAMGGYGRAYNYATQMMTAVRDEFLVPIRENKKMNIILLSHSTKVKVEDPLTQSSYDRFELKLHKNKQGLGAYTVFTDWVSIIAFAKFEVYKVTDKKTQKDFAVGDGKRVMYLTPKPAYDAKNRFNLPDQMDLKWSDLASGVKAYYSN